MRLPSPNALLKLYQLEQVANDLCSRVLNASTDRDCTDFLSNLLGTLRNKMFFFFLIFRWNFLYFSFCPLSLLRLLNTTERSMSPCSLSVINSNMFPSVFLPFSSLNSPSTFGISLYQQMLQPLLNFVAFQRNTHISVVFESPKLGLAVEM